ncbi:MAG: hypothetical protein CBB71_20005 [Rhodopirellula sp. TMED11]|nr:MAG: hypothetical protein CBB71_20005 [Rhodopirellula sp. TMED11]
MTDDSEAINPYRPSESIETAPLAGMGAEIPKLTFRGTIRTSDQRLSMIKPGIRKDLTDAKSSTMGVLVMLTALFFLTDGAQAAIDRPLPVGCSIFALLAVQAYRFFTAKRRLTKRLNLAHDNESTIEGWMDTETFYISIDDGLAVGTHPMKQLVGSACDDFLWSLCFFPSYLLWQTIPINAFETPTLARQLARQVQQQRPPTHPQLNVTPEDLTPVFPTLRQADSDALMFGGMIHFSDIRLLENGKRFLRRVSRRVYADLLPIVVFMIAAIVITDFSEIAIMVSVIAIASVVLLIAWRTFRTKRSNGGLGLALFDTQGWIDQQGVAFGNARSQGMFRWDYWSGYEIQPDAASIYRQDPLDLGQLFARRQFACDADWERACQLIRDNVSQPDSTGGNRNTQEPAAHSQP